MPTQAFAAQGDSSCSQTDTLKLNSSFLIVPLVMDLLGSAGSGGSRTGQGGLPGADSQGWRTLWAPGSPGPRVPQLSLHSTMSRARPGRRAEPRGIPPLLLQAALTEKSTDPDEPTYRGITGKCGWRGDLQQN